MSAPTPRPLFVVPPDDIDLVVDAYRGPVHDVAVYKMLAFCMYDACMGEVIQVRNVPEDVHADLKRQAQEAGLSLNRFLLGEFERIARRGQNAELLTRAARRKGRRVPSSRIVEEVRADRQRGR